VIQAICDSALEEAETLRRHGEVVLVAGEIFARVGIVGLRSAQAPK
jgi:hypothetical protein